MSGPNDPKPLDGTQPAPLDEVIARAAETPIPSKALDTPAAVRDVLRPAPVFDDEEREDRYDDEDAPEREGTIGEAAAAERPGARDVINVVDARMPAELEDGINDAHAGFAAYRAAAEAHDEEAMKAAVIRFDTGVNKIEMFMELRSLTEDAPLHPMERIDVLCRVILGKDRKSSDGALATVFEELQKVEMPADAHGDPIRLFQGQMDILREHIGCNERMCFSGPEFDAMLLGLLRIDWWGTRDAQLTVAGATVSAGGQAAQIRKLGEGAFGKVLHVIPGDPEHESIAAKYPVSEKEAAISKIAGEAEAGPRCIAKMGQQRILLMVFEKGAVPMDEYLRDRAFDPALMSRLAAQMAKLHARGIVHRDIKPANVLVLPDGSPLVIDYGLGDMPEGGKGKYPRHKVIGSPRYLPPEAFMKEEYSPQTDVYALGCIAFESATGMSWSKEVCRVTGNDPEQVVSVMMATATLEMSSGKFEEALKLAETKAGPKARDVLRKLLHPKQSQRAQTAAEAAELLQTLAA